MERRGVGLGCIVAGLGATLSLCLLPYLISSVYAIAALLLKAPAGSTWLWGDWLTRFVQPTSSLYRVLVEAPICCVGILALLTVIIGIVWAVGGEEREEESYLDEESED